MSAILKMIVLTCTCMIIGKGQPAMATNNTYSSLHELPACFMAMKLSEFIKMPAKDFISVTGKKMKLMERISFSLLKKSMKKSLKSNPDQTINDFLATVPKNNKHKILVIFLIVLAVLIMVSLIVLSTLNIGFGG